MGDIIKLSAALPTPKNGDLEATDEDAGVRRLYWELPILFEDEDILAIDKPAGLLATQSHSVTEAPDILSLFCRDIQRGASWATSRKLSFLDCVYLLDSDTTGVLLFTKNREAQDSLSSFLGSEKPFRLFLAIVHGLPQNKVASDSETPDKQEAIRVHAGLIPHPTRPGMVKVDVKRGKKAITDFHLLESFNSYTFLECRPVTDRYLQIRAHLRYIKCPVVCDHFFYGRPLYLSSLKAKYHPSNKHDERPLMGRAALHCSRIEIPHPRTGEKIVIESPLPKDFKASLRMLRQFGIKRWGH